MFLNYCLNLMDCQYKHRLSDCDATSGTLKFWGHIIVNFSIFSSAVETFLVKIVLNFYLI